MIMVLSSEINYGCVPTLPTHRSESMVRFMRTKSRQSWPPKYCHPRMTWSCHSSLAVCRLNSRPRETEHVWAWRTANHQSAEAGALSVRDLGPFIRVQLSKRLDKQQSYPKGCLSCSDTKAFVCTCIFVFHINISCINKIMHTKNIYIYICIQFHRVLIYTRIGWIAYMCTYHSWTHIRICRLYQCEPM